MSFFKMIQSFMGVPFYGAGSPVSGLARKTVFSLVMLALMFFFMGALVLKFPIIVGVIVAAFLFLAGAMCLSFAIKLGVFHRRVHEQFSRHVEVDSDDVIDV